ncbi:hypothetical protein JTB14_016856 [Gonioctena quinquepunctata]|nr:hypothetical protein JTB14_016856 [Gonioctena quinquepunctata]
MAAISSWTTIPNVGFSDHFPTMCSIGLGLGDGPPSNERRNYSKADWEKYNSILGLSFSSFATGNNYDYFEESLNTAAKSSIPLYKPAAKSKYHIPWWDDSCSDITKKRIEAIRQFKIDPSWNNYLIVKKQCAAARKFLKIKRKNNFQEFCSKLNRNSPTEVVWDIIRKISGQKASLQLSMPQAHVAQEILNSLAPPIFTSSNINSDNGPTSSNITSISYSEYNFILKDKKESAPGLDQISYSMIKNLPLSGSLLLLQIFNSCLGFQSTETTAYPAYYKTK